MIVNKFGLFKTPAHRRFNYEPRYYDERREELERKIKRHQEMKELSESEESSLRARYSMQQKIEDSWQPTYRKQSNRSTMRLIVILGALVTLAYLLFLRIDGLALLFQGQ